MSDYPCPGRGKCHGCMSWCDECGDVAGVCDCAVCWQHRCHVCNKLLDDDEREMAFALGGRPSECFTCFPKVEAARELANGEDEMPALERAAETIDVYRRPRSRCNVCGKSFQQPAWTEEPFPHCNGCDGISTDLAISIARSERKLRPA